MYQLRPSESQPIRLMILPPVLALLGRLYPGKQAKRDAVGCVYGELLSSGVPTENSVPAIFHLGSM